MSITQNVKQILRELPDGTQLVAVVKNVAPAEIMEAIDAGVTTIGENYIQEATAAFAAIGRQVQWHFIGHLQKNKVKKAVGMFDMIETVDSVDIAREISKRCAEAGKIMPVLIEVNSGREEQKAGVFPELVEGLIAEISGFGNIKVAGLMTMGPPAGDPEDSRTYFIETKRVFDHVAKLGLPGVEMRFLSMGMSNSYRIALEEGANIVRIGHNIFRK